MDLHLLLNIFVFLVAGCLVVPAAQRFRLGPVLGRTIPLPLVIGPFGLSLISQPDKVMQVAEIGVIMMMFLIGMELEPAVLWRMRRAIVGLGSAQVDSDIAGLHGHRHGDGTHRLRTGAGGRHGAGPVLDGAGRCRC